MLITLERHPLCDRGAPERLLNTTEAGRCVTGAWRGKHKESGSALYGCNGKLRL